jgi:hygromycin-B 7''-O-kinase
MELNARIEKVVKSAFPCCNILLIENIMKGFMNKKFIIKIANPDKELILKIGESKRLEEIHTLKEAAILKLVKEKVPELPVPEIFLSREKDDVFDAHYVLMSRLPGTDLSDIWGDLTEQEKKDIVYHMGKYLAKLHTMKFDKFGHFRNDGSLDNPADRWDKVAIPEVFRELGGHEVLQINSEGFRNEIISFIRSKMRVFAEQKEPTLVHNDWHKDHFRVEKVDGKWKIVGIIDFEFAESAPKLYDFVKSERWLFRDEPFTKEPFLQGYKDAGGILPENYEGIMRVFRAHHKIFFIRRLFEGGYHKDVEEYTRRLKELMKQ